MSWGRPCRARVVRVQSARTRPACQHQNRAVAHDTPDRAMPALSMGAAGGLGRMSGFLRIAHQTRIILAAKPTGIGRWQRSPYRTPTFIDVRAPMRQLMRMRLNRGLSWLDISLFSRRLRITRSRASSPNVSTHDDTNHSDVRGANHSDVRGSPPSEPGLHPWPRR